MTQHKQIGRVSTESVHKGSGKHWDEWIPLLQKAGAGSWTHTEIAAYLKKKYKLSPWWQQGVALGFEIAVGLRIEGQNSKGLYTVTATKALTIDAKKIWQLIVSELGVQAWLKPLYAVSVKVGNEFETEDGFFGQIRTMKKDRRIRMSWQDPAWDKNSIVQITLVDRPKAKSILVIDHSQLKDLKTKALFKKRWKGVLEELSMLSVKS